MRRLAVLGLVLLGGCIPPGAGADNQAWTPPPRERPAPPPQTDDWTPRETEPVEVPPAPRPAWEAASVTTDAQSIAASNYLVQPGDTLRGIADRTGSGSEAIARENGLEPPYTVRVGQELRIPGGRYHLVRAGQTGIAIARAYGVPWAEIVAANALSQPYILRSGQRILIPGGHASSAAERAAAFKLDIDDILTGGEPAIAENQRPAHTSGPERRLPPTVAVAPPARFAGRFTWPLHGPIVAAFGAGASGTRNNGVKIGAPVGTPIKAAASGTVVYVGDDVPGLGGLVMILHGSGWTSVYGHASRILVHRGEAVRQGQTIALSGATGFADRPELHFELRKGRTPVDPLSELPGSQGGEG